jgi:hypothetical protein
LFKYFRGGRTFEDINEGRGGINKKFMGYENQRRN